MLLVHADIQLTAMRLSIQRYIFVYNHDNDWAWTKKYIINKISASRTIKTTLDFELGAAIIDEMLASITECQWIMMVLSKRFFSDDWCRSSVVQVHSQHRAASIVPVVLEYLRIPNDDLLMTELMDTYELIY